MLPLRSILIGLFFLIVSLPATVFGLEIHFQAEAEVRGENVTLGEISRITPDSERARQLAALKLFKAPQPGRVATWRAADATKQISNSHNETLEDIEWGGADTIRIRRAAIHIGPEEIREILDSYLSRNKNYLPPATIRLKDIHLAQPFDLPTGILETEVIPADPSILSSHRFTVIFRVDSKVEKNIAIRAELEAIAPVAVAAANLQRGTVIHDSDISLVQLDIIPLRNPCLDPAELIGKRIKRSVRHGYPFDRLAVELPPIIRRGELVTIFVRKGPLLVTAKGIARHDAIQGAMVKVLNRNSKKEILCRADGPGLVQVEL
jgi:flagella basal body P-ring formation protein FlgA